ncbi:MAG: hypothetical protein F6K22_02235 [Okeania sp. SIO2F4]|uniref:hypothetical protein n=1 Tax=Okeania sp. SIO2F4 TaxID=2607790 RepID=UPI00142C3611|nr:hypothetical protein [Okeania sp. SIO2F4]NES01742.1 hypothetical protein [Okeania sp. SIO2F4]
MKEQTDQELFEFIKWFKDNYQLDINHFEIKLLLKAAENANLTVDPPTRTALAALMKQHNLTPENTVKLYLDAQSQNNSSNFVDELIDKTVQGIKPQISDAVIIAKAEITAMFLEEFNTPGGGSQVDDFANQYKSQVSSSLESRKEALNQRFNRLLNAPPPPTVDEILELLGNNLG